MNAVIYARVSSYNTERSIERQIEDCMAYAQKNGFNVVRSYIDREKSGTSAEQRTDFLKMISDSTSRQFEAVLVWKMDRFSRNHYDSAMAKMELKKNGVRVISVNEPISDDPTGMMLEFILEGAAEISEAFAETSPPPVTTSPAPETKAPVVTQAPIEQLVKKEVI